MVFWIIAIALAGVAALFLALALMRGRMGDAPPAAYDLQVYRDQLKEVDRDLARGVIGASDADRIRIEISRRILAADAQVQAHGADGGQPKTAGYIAVALMTLLVIGGGAGLYSKIGAPGYGDLPLKQRIAMAQERHQNRDSQADFIAKLPAVSQPGQAAGQYRELMDKLRQAVADRPDELQGQILLARNEAALGNLAAAYGAQGHVLRLKGDDASAQDHLSHADLMINAAQGYVSPQAEAALLKAIELDGNSPLARYYWGLMLVQNDRPDQAFRLWEQLLRVSTPDAPWVPPIRARIEELAWMAGVDYTLPPAPALAPALAPAAVATTGPTSEDIENAAEMNTEDRQAMIRSMVQQLNDRLASQGGSPAEWARLISALGVLQDSDRAKLIWDEAQSIFANDPEALDQVRAGARQAGILQ